MSKRTDDWPKQFDQCQISFEVEREVSTFESSASDDFIGHFVAHVTSPNGDYVAGKSPPIRFPYADSQGQFLPDAQNGRHQNALRIFLNSLQNGGWELLPEERGDEWYAHRLQRPMRIPEKKTLRPREKLAIPLAIVAAILLAAYVTWSALRPFTNGVSQYQEFPITVSADEPYRRGKILIVNPFPAPITSPLRGRPDTLHWQLPDDVRAENYDEISMVVWNACRYPVRRGKLETICRVTIIDYATKEQVAYREFESEPVDPPPLDERDATRDEAGILAFILGLPEKPE